MYVSLVLRAEAPVREGEALIIEIEVNPTYKRKLFCISHLSIGVTTTIKLLSCAFIRHLSSPPSFKPNCLVTDIGIVVLSD